MTQNRLILQVKQQSDHLVRSYGNTYGLPFIISNCSNNYGPEIIFQKN